MPALINSYLVEEGMDLTLNDHNTVVEDVRVLAYLKRAVRRKGTRLLGASGDSTLVTALLLAVGAVAGGGETAVGVITASPHNKVLLRATGGAEPDDGSGNPVYGRLTLSAGAWTLAYYSAPAGVETNYSFASPTDLDWYYFEVFDLLNQPFLQDGLEVISDEATTTIPQATSLVSGKVLLGAPGGALALSPGATQTVAFQGPTVGLILQMAGAHVANPLDIRDATNTSVWRVDKDGSLFAKAGAFSANVSVAGTKVVLNATSGDVTAEGKISEQGNFLEDRYARKVRDLCRVKLQASLVTNNGAWGSVNWSSATATPDAMWSSSVNRSRLIVQKNGNYLISAQLSVAANASSANLRYYVRKNGTTILCEGKIAAHPTEPQSTRIQDVHLLVAGDYLELFVGSDTGTVTILGDAAGTVSFMSAALL